MMHDILRRLITRNWQPGKAAWVGVIATIIYSIVMEGDKFLVGNRFNDVRFIEGLFMGKRRTKSSFILAWLLHLVNGVALAELYAALVKRFLPGPDWLKGTLFTEIFITSAWWLTPLADKYHPLIKSGEMPPLANKKAFLQNIVRHLAFGLTLGWLYHDDK